MLLMAEMSLFVVLIVPLPFNLKRKIFTYVFSSLVSCAKLLYPVMSTVSS